MKYEQALQANDDFGPDGISKVAASSELPREQILHAAARLFRRYGYAGTTLRQIASVADMKAGSIYYHFKSKDQIVDEVLDIGTRAVFDAVRAAVASLGSDASAEDKIRIALDAHLRALFSKGEFTSANVRIYSQLPGEIKARHQHLRRAYAEYWEKLFASAQQAGTARADLDVVQLRQFVLGALTWTIEWFHPEKNDIGDLVEQTSALIFEGILGA